MPSSGYLHLLEELAGICLGLFLLLVQVNFIFKQRLEVIKVISVSYDKFNQAVLAIIAFFVCFRL